MRADCAGGIRAAWRDLPDAVFQQFPRAVAVDAVGSEHRPAPHSTELRELLVEGHAREQVRDPRLNRLRWIFVWKQTHLMMPRERSEAMVAAS